VTDTHPASQPRCRSIYRAYYVARVKTQTFSFGLEPLTGQKPVLSKNTARPSLCLGLAWPSKREIKRIAISSAKYCNRTKHCNNCNSANTHCRERAVHRLQVDSLRLRHTSTLYRYTVHLYIDTDDSDKLYQQAQHTAPILTNTCKQLLLFT